MQKDLEKKQIMARLVVRPVTVSPSPGVWSYTLILSDSHVLSQNNPPAWIVVLTITDEHAENIGEDIVTALDQAYQTDETKSPEFFFGTLKHLFQNNSLSVIALHLTDTVATVFGKGLCTAHLWRHHQHGIVLVGSTEWQVIEGPTAIEERWWLVAGDCGDIIDGMEAQISESTDDLENTAETLQTILAKTSVTSFASALITNLPETEILESPVSPAMIKPPITQIKNIRKRRRVMFVGWAVLGLLILSVWFGAKTRTERQLAANYASLEKQVNDAIIAAQALQPVDQVKARDELRQTLTAVSTAQSTFTQNKSYQAKWNALNLKMTTAYQQLAGEADVTNLPIWFTLSVVRPGFVGDQLAVIGTNIVVLDKSSNSLVQIGIDSKHAEIVAGGDSIKGAVNFAGSNNRVVVLFDSGVVDVSLTRQTTTPLIPHDNTWQQPSAVAFFNGNVYVLDIGGGQIWRYSASGQGVGSKTAWLGAGVNVSDNTYTGMAVDGDLWLLKSTGALLRFRRGAPLTFSITGLDVPLSNSTTALAVSPDQDVIAILDQGNQRVVRLNKEGVYQKQVKWSGLSAAQSIGLSDDGNTLYILKNGSIYTTQF